MRSSPVDPGHPGGLLITEFLRSTLIHSASGSEDSQHSLLEPPSIHEVRMTMSSYCCLRSLAANDLGSLRRTRRSANPPYHDTYSRDVVHRWTGAALSHDEQRSPSNHPTGNPMSEVRSTGTTGRYPLPPYPPSRVELEAQDLGGGQNPPLRGGSPGRPKMTDFRGLAGDPKIGQKPAFLDHPRGGQKRPIFGVRERRQKPPFLRGVGIY